jgi:hypothetical protein
MAMVAGGGTRVVRRRRVVPLPPSLSLFLLRQRRGRSRMGGRGSHREGRRGRVVGWLVYRNARARARRDGRARTRKKERRFALFVERGTILRGWSI